MTWERPALTRLTDRVRERSGRPADPVADDQRGVHAWLRRAPTVPLAELQPEAFQQLPAASWDPGRLARLAAGVRKRSSVHMPPPEHRIGRLEPALDGWTLAPDPVEGAWVVAVALWAVFAFVVFAAGPLGLGVAVALVALGVTPPAAGAVATVMVMGAALAGGAAGAPRMARLRDPVRIGTHGVERGPLRLAWGQIVDVTRRGDCLELRAVDGRVLTTPALWDDEMAIVEPFARARLVDSLADEADDDGLRRAVHALVHAGR